MFVIRRSLLFPFPHPDPGLSGARRLNWRAQLKIERASDMEYIWKSRDGTKLDVSGCQGEGKEFGEVRERTMVDGKRRGSHTE